MNPNKSKTYLAPLLFSELTGFEFFRVENTYTAADIDETVNRFFILYNTAGLIRETKREIFSQCKIIYQVEKSKYLLGLHIPKKHRFEFLCFKYGMYSQFRASAKDSIMKYLYS